MSAPIPGVHSDPEILGGTPVFVGTRVPVRAMLDYLEHDRPLVEFLEDLGGRSSGTHEAGRRRCACCSMNVSRSV